MTDADLKTELTAQLGRLNDAVLAKADGLSEYDLRRPMTPTGSNILGIIKHLGYVQAGYLGDCFGRPWPHPIPAREPDAEVNTDMWATPEEDSAGVLAAYRESWSHALETIGTTVLEATGTVDWWPDERRHPTLATVLAHMLVETGRHAGHIDVIRELIDSAAGRYAGDPSLPTASEIDWPAYVARLEAAAATFRD